MAALKAWARSLPERHGRKTLLILAAILAVGFGLRAYRVVEPLGTPGDDAHAYYALAKSLYTEGSYGGPEFEDASDWSPGAPLLYAAAFYATGGPREGTARIVELLLGLAAIVVVYLLGRRIACRPAGLFAAFCVAVYPPFVHSTGALFSEPPAMLTLPAAVLAFLWAGGIGGTTEGPSAPARGSRHGERGAMRADLSSAPLSPRHPRVSWVLPALLFGITALIRPEYLLVGLAFVLLATLRTGTSRNRKEGLIVAALSLIVLLLPIVPWAVRNQVVLHRTVPISTGGGKALYVGTYLPADGEYQRVKAILLKRYRGIDLPPQSEALEKVDPKPLFDRAARRYPDLTRDQALGRIGKKNFSKYFGEDPLGYLAMTARKAGRIWSSGIAEAMSSPLGRAIQIVLVLLGLAGLAVLGARRRWWELVALATPIVLVTGVGAITLAAPRRNEVLMTLVFPLAAAALARAGGALSSSAAWSSRRASSPAS